MDCVAVRKMATVDWGSASMMGYIRETYKVPAKRGMRVRFNGLNGRIVGSRGGYLRVRLDGSKRPLICHPTWEMVYL